MFQIAAARFGSIKNDTLSGLTVALALVPEAVAFAFVAHVSPEVGLWAAVIVGLLAAALGGRPGMISGATGALAVIDGISRNNVLILDLPTKSRHTGRQRIDGAALYGMLLGLTRDNQLTYIGTEAIHAMPVTGSIGVFNTLSRPNSQNRQLISLIIFRIDRRSDVSSCRSATASASTTSP